MNPFSIMVVLFAALAALAVLDSSLSSMGLLVDFGGLRWLRGHFVALGLVTEAAFGLLPELVASQSGRPRPSVRWDIWLLLNTGIATLLVGIPVNSPTLIAVGGTLILVAAGLLLVQLFSLAGGRTPAIGTSGIAFYAVGLGYLLLGAFIGTGLWLGWGEALGIGAPKEVHVHANLWGFTSLIFAGLVVDLYPSFAKRSLAWPRSLPVVFVLLSLGALGLVAGPWLEVNLFTLLGLVLHTVGTVWLLSNVIRPLRTNCQARTAGLMHLITAYAWYFVPVISAPLIVLRPPWFPADLVADQGAGILLYGWALQVLIAIVPFLVGRSLFPNGQAQLGGNWLSLTAAHLGTAFYLFGLFVEGYRGPAQGVAFALWALAIAAAAIGMWWRVRPADRQLVTTGEKGGAADVAAPR